MAACHSEKSGARSWRTTTTAASPGAAASTSVYNCKALGSGEFYPEACVQDVERGVMSGINPLPWQTDTSNGDWFFTDGDNYKTAPDVIRMLADIVSKNGNLLLNVVLYPDGSLPPESQTLCCPSWRPG